LELYASIDFELELWASVDLDFFIFSFLGGDDWATQNGILSDCIPHWFEGIVSVLCNPIFDSMALLGDSSDSVLS
jgi:hypothetical protein